MKFKVFTFSVRDAEFLVDEMNNFIDTHRILNVERHFCAENGGYWTFLLEYIDNGKAREPYPINRKKPKVDYSTILDESTFKRFLKMKEIRLRLAKERGIAPYLIFTDAELAVIAKIEDLGSITGNVDGVNKKRFDENISFFISDNTDEATGKSNTTDSGQG